MSSSPTEHWPALAGRVRYASDAIAVDLTDGRTISVPLVWYPRIAHASLEERDNWRLLGRGEGVRWPDLDEDISVENLLAGVRSGESHESFQQWLKSRTGSVRP